MTIISLHAFKYAFTSYTLPLLHVHFVSSRPKVRKVSRLIELDINESRSADTVRQFEFLKLLGDLLAFSLDHGRLGSHQLQLHGVELRTALTGETGSAI